MKTTRFFTALLTAAFLLSGCSGNSNVIKFDIPAGVSTLDPQFATDPVARMIVSNTFDTLLRRDPAGKLVESLSESYTVSADGLVYTFVLRGNAVWYQMSSKSTYSGTPVTAADFRFAIRRIFNPDAPSPFVNELSCIKNAQAVLAGEAGSDSLGVRAIDDRTLEITLDRPDSLFLERLASSYTAPCNRDFFESTRARYGLDPKNVIACGAFYIRAWDNDEAILLRRNPNVTPPVEKAVSGLNLQITKEDAATRFLDGETDLCRIGAGSVENAQRRGGTVAPFEDTVWLLAFNQYGDAFSNDDIRRALSLSFDHSQLGDTLLDEFRTAYSLLTPAVNFSSGVTLPSMGGVELRQLYSSGMDALGLDETPITELLVCDIASQKLTASHVQQGLQNSLSLFVNLKPLPKDELISRVNLGNFTAAIVPLTISSSSPTSLLELFRTDAPENFTGYSNPDFDILLDTLPADGANRSDGWRQAEQFLLDDCAAVPLIYETTYFATQNGVSGIGLSPFLPDLRFDSAVKD